jgi:hypothetical protein
MSHLAPAILVYEKRPRWESELKRACAGERTLIRPCRSPTDLLELCRSMPGSVIVADLEAGTAHVLRCLEQVLLERLAAHPLIIAPAEAGDLEWSFRELGALGVLPESTRGEELADLCRRALGVGAAL